MKKGFLSRPQVTVEWIHLMSLRETIRKLTPYSPGKPIEELRREFGITGEVIKLASNENPLGPSPKAVEALRNASGEVHRYPDASGFELRQALAKKHKIPIEQIVLGSGSDELIHYIGLIFLEPGDHQIMAHPGFSRYEALATLVGATTSKVPVDEDGKHDLDAMAKEVNEKTKIIWIANPNNPTGTIVRKKELRSFHDELPSDIILVFDEAYFDFVEDSEMPDSLEWIKENRANKARVIGLRSFSKTYGLAGLRIGYGVFPPDIADAIHRVRMPFNANLLAQIAARAAIEDEKFLERSKRANREAIEKLTAICKKYNAKVCESHANFVWADFGRPTLPIYEALLKKGVIVRPGASFGAPNCLRISTGLPHELEIFEKAIGEVLEPQADVSQG